MLPSAQRAVKDYSEPELSHSYKEEVRQLWLRCRASVMLLEGRWFDSPGLHVEVSLQDTEPQTAPDVLVSTLHSTDPISI